MTDLSELLAEAADAVGKWRGGDVLWEERVAGDLSELVRQCLGNSSVRFVVGVVEDLVVGMGIAGVTSLADGRKLAQVRAVYVLEAARRVGVGEAIMADLLSWGDSQGCHGIDAVALPGDRLTKNFFESHGMSARSLTLFKRFS